MPARRCLHKHREDLKRGSKECIKCNTRLPFDSFFKKNTSLDGRDSNCKSCRSNKTGLKRGASEIERDIKLQSKLCRTCKEVKSFDNFYNSKSSSDGKCTRCKTCDNEARKRSKDNNPEANWKSIRRSNLKNKYGLTLEDYENMLKLQNECCAICKLHISENKVSGRFNSLSVDHCHDTGKIRGLLCNQCNRAIGMLGDKPDNVLKAYEYLMNHYKDSH